MPATDDRLTSIRDYLYQSAEVLRATGDACAADIAKAVDLLVECYRAGGKVLLCGNGGSAAQCQHLAAELVNGLSRDRPHRPLAAIALTTDTSVLTAIANDFGFEQVFERQVEALGRPGDVLIAISTSGRSPNVLRAIEKAGRRGLAPILLTGLGEGSPLLETGLVVRVASRDTQEIQLGHTAAGHLLCGLVASAIHGDEAEQGTR